MEFSPHIRQALDEFMKSTGSKKTFLFHQGQAYHFYNQEFCSIDYASLFIAYRYTQVAYQLNSGTTIDTIFIQVEPNRIVLTTDKAATCYEADVLQQDEFKIALSYGILYDPELKQYLRGFAYVDTRLSNQVFASYFTDPILADFLELIMFQQITPVSTVSCVKNPAIGEQVKHINQQDVKALSKVYLKGKDIDTFFKGAKDK